jgi:hypothetical protein
MASDGSRPIISSAYDAGLVPRLWPAALQSVLDAVGGVGASYVVWNNQTNQGELPWSSQ